MRSHRSWPILLVGFGTLTALIAVTGLSALRRARETYREVSALNARYREAERILNRIGNNITVVGLNVRDYIFSPTAAEEDRYRARLLSLRGEIDADFQRLAGVIPVDEVPKVNALRDEVNGTWTALNPMFGWTPQQKAAQGWRFLQRQVLPRRQEALKIRDEIRELTRSSLDREQQDIDAEQADMPVFIGRMLAITLLIGLAIAGVSVYRMTQLERRADEQRRRTEAAEEEMRRLSRQLVQTQEEERKSISRELHDEIGQMLTGLKMELGSLHELRNAPDGFDDHLEGARHLAEQSLRAVRDMALGLRPSMLDDLGLGSALQWQARQFAKHTGVPVNVQIDGALGILPERHRTCVYRVVQEALTNCARHAQAKTIRVAVSGQNGRLHVTVQDDGVGFYPSTTRGQGMGLIGMYERVKELGGDLTLKSQPQKGTVLSATIPLREETAEA